MADFRKGDPVWIVQVEGGKAHLEGRAEIVGPTLVEDRWRVRFENGDVVERYVHPLGRDRDPDRLLAHVETILQLIRGEILDALRHR